MLSLGAYPLQVMNRLTVGFWIILPVAAIAFRIHLHLLHF